MVIIGTDLALLAFSGFDIWFWDCYVYDNIQE